MHWHNYGVEKRLSPTRFSGEFSIYTSVWVLKMLYTYNYYYRRH